MVLEHNMPAFNANRYLKKNNTRLGKSLEKLSSGFMINRSADDAAGLAVSEKMRSQIAGMDQGVSDNALRAGEAFTNIAKRIMGYEVPIMEFEVKKGFFGRLRQILNG